MSIKRKLLLFSAAVLITACGGGGSSTPDPVPIPAPTDTTAPTISVPSGALTVIAGEELEFEVSAMDSSGFGMTVVSCSDGSLTTTTNTTADSQTVTITFNAPAAAGTVTCTATSTDSVGNAGDVAFEIAVTPADTTAPTLSISSDDLTVFVGEELEFEVLAMDSSGFESTNVSCNEGSVAATTSTTADTQTVAVTFGAPATAGTVTCTATSTDSVGNAGDIAFEISVTPAPVSTASFNGTWFSPCFNNGFGFSVRQTITINGTNLTSDIESFTGGENPARNCRLPAEGLLITADVGASLSFGSNVSLAGCVNGLGVDTDVNIQTVNTSGNPTATSEPAISDTLNLLTGFVNILPSSTDICALTNGNLLFAGVEYTGGSNTDLILPSFDVTSDTSWSFADNNYVGGVSSGSQSVDTNLGITVVSTDRDTSNGDFSGSGLTLTYPLNGSGVYQLTNTVGLVSAEPDDQVITIGTTVGTATVSSTGYSSLPNGGFVVAVVDGDGEYHFSTESTVRLGDAVDVNGGVPGAPDTIDLEMTNIFNFSE